MNDLPEKSNTEITKKDKTKPNPIEIARRRQNEITGIVMAAIGLLLFLGVVIKSEAVILKALREFFFGLFGTVAYIVPLGIFASGIVMLANFKREMPKSKIVLSVCLFYSLMMLYHLLCRGSWGQYDSYFSFMGMSYELGRLSSLGGGIVASLLLYPIFKLIDFVGAYILVIAAILVLIIPLFDISVGSIVRKALIAGKKGAEKGVEKTKELHHEKAEQKKLMREQQKAAEKTASKKTAKAAADDEDDDIPHLFDGDDEDDGPVIIETNHDNKKAGEGPSVIQIPAHDAESAMITVNADDSLSAETDPFEEGPVISFAEGAAHTAHTETKSDVNEDVPEITVVDSEEIKSEDDAAEERQYIFPPSGLLSSADDSEEDRLSHDEELQRAKLLEDTLRSFDVPAKVTHIMRGPVITRYELKLETGIRVNKVTNLADNLAYSLAVQSIRIEAPIPGKTAIGIELPNKKRVNVFLREVLESEEFIKSDARIAAGLGKDIAGNPIVFDIARMPHILIAGATGSGKSVCINSIIISILFKYKPEEVRLIMVDPKVVELSVYNGIPHLLSPVVTDPAKAAGTLNWAVNEMMQRYKKLAEYKVRDITNYNKIKRAANEPQLPYIVIIIDELADLMMVAPKDIEGAICRLAQMARAVGIHMVLATQRPSVDVITGLIKANVPSRIAFTVSSQIDSRTILDMAGAEKLLNRGDMLYFPMGASKPMRVQGAFVTDREVEQIIAYIKSTSGEDIEYDDMIQQASTEVFTGGDENEDELMREALLIGVEQGQMSISLLQRKLRIGYARSARIVDQMEEKGYIAGYDGTSKPRNMLIDRAKFNELYGTEDDIS